MSISTADDALLRHTDPDRARPLPSAIGRARAELPAIAADILAIPEAALEREWTWIGGGEADLRYGIYRLHEILERADIDASRVLRADSRDSGLAADLIAPAGAVRWDLHGLLAPLSDVEIDADPGGGEWTIRQTLGHIVSGQRAYGWATAWWQEQGLALHDPDLPATLPDGFWANLPDEHGAEIEGLLDDVRARLDAILDLSAERLAGVPDERLGFAARWQGFAVPISFRLGRWSSHIREHTIQVEKTLATLGRVPTEPERLVRLTLAAYGRAEAVVLGQPEADTAAEVVRAALEEAAATIAGARRAVEA
jgi:DinB superfamily